MTRARHLAGQIAAVAAVVLALLIGAPSAAFASGSATCQAYNAQLCGQVTPAQTATQSSGGLPFTGLDLGLLAAGGVFLAGTGLLVRWLVRPGVDGSAVTPAIDSRKLD